MNVLSVFDGMSCGQLALNNIGVKIDNYYASEIDKDSIAVTQHNYKSTVQLGNINNIKSLPKIDLMIGGFPCQDFSFAGKLANFSGSRGKLFFELVRVLNLCKPRYFLFENVNMRQEYIDVINEKLGVEPIKINSKLLSGQLRNRLYWTNIPFEYPLDQGILLQSILESGIVDRDKSYCIDANYSKGKPERYFKRYRDQIVFTKVKDKSEISKLDYDLAFRKLTVKEVERLQTVTDDYTMFGNYEGTVKRLSNTKRYRLLGNGFTVDIISHILKGIL